MDFPADHFPSADIPPESGRDYPDDNHLVLILDDDQTILNSLGNLLTLHGYQVRLHQAASDLLEAGLPTVPACLLLDQQLANGQCGLEVHAKLLRLGWDLPTVFVTAHWNVQTVVNAIRAGADGFLAKPYDPEQLVAAVARALARARGQCQNGTQASLMRARAASLTSREREIVRLVVAGMLNKEIAHELDIALVTVKLYRSRAMHKLGAGNAAELARIAALAGITR